MSPTDFRDDLLKWILAQGQENFNENSRITGVIEDKAQKCAALAGVFLAAGLAFLKKENFDAAYVFAGVDTLLLLSFSILASIGCIGFSLAVLWVKRNPTPLSTPWLSSVSEDVMQLPDDRLTPEIQGGHRWLLIHAVNEKVEEQMKGNADRVRSLKWAQALLGGAIVLIALASLSVLFNVGLSRVACFVP